MFAILMSIKLQLGTSCLLYKIYNFAELLSRFYLFLLYCLSGILPPAFVCSITRVGLSEYCMSLILTRACVFCMFCLFAFHYYFI